MNCSLSGEVPQVPVVSRKSGHVFERRLIEKHLESSNTCPVTGGELTKDDLIEVKSTKTVPPRDIAATSIPGMLSLFQKEWDATMLETHVLRKNLQTLRQELAQALYQHDAACRVIARLIKERDQALAAYKGAQTRATAGGAGATGGAQAAAVTAAPGGDQGGDGKSVPPAVLQIMKAKGDELKAARMQRKKPATLASKAQVASFKETSSHTPHSSVKPGITCVDIHHVHQNVIATGGLDKKIKIFDRNTKKVVGTASGHSKKITSVAWHPSQAVLFSSSDDNTIRVWAAEGNKYSQKASFDAHERGATGVTVHPTGTFAASSSFDGTWKLHDCSSARTVMSAVDPSARDKGVSSLTFHPDGLILATGAGTGTISLWDMKAAATAQRTLEGHSQAVLSLQASENGYTMASGSADGVVRLWDLRKLKCVKTLDMGSPVNTVRFDHSGTYLACGSNDTRVLHVKSWKTQATIAAQDEDAVLGVALTNDARVLVSVGEDRHLRIYDVVS